MNSSLHSRAGHILSKLNEFLENENYTGYDPFDMLDAPIFKHKKLCHGRLLKLVGTQLNKKSPLNFRPILGITKRENAKALSLLVRGFEAQDNRKKAQDLRRRLVRHQNADGGFGYPFDWQARAFFLPSGLSNAVVSSYAVLALQGERSFDSLILNVADFIERDLGRGSYLSYVPCGDVLVHNASLWGAWVLAKAQSIGGGSPSRETLITACIEQTLSTQNGEGGFPYGAAPHHQFIDSFHTGFVLEALWRIHTLIPHPQILQALERGLKFYLRTFFSEDGKIKYYPHTPYPMDPKCWAQLVITLDTLGQISHHQSLIDKTLGYVMEHFWDETRGVFYYQKTVFLPIRLPTCAGHKRGCILDYPSI